MTLNSVVHKPPKTRSAPIMSTTQLHADLSQKTTADVGYKIAATRQDRAAAFRLVYKSYLRTGLGEPNRHEMRVTPYHLLPTTEVFIATCRGQVISTVTLVIDGQLGLPMESIYAKEVALRREQGYLLGEVSCLADRRSQFIRFFPVFLRLTRLMVQYARRQGLDELLAAVHPKHAKFYRRFMDFEVIGQERIYPTVRNHPAVALSLNFDRIDRERPHSYETFFAEAIPDEQLQPRPITTAECSYFRRMIDHSFAPAPLADGHVSSQNGTAKWASAGAALAGTRLV